MVSHEELGEKTRVNVGLAEKVYYRVCTDGMRTRSVNAHGICNNYYNFSGLFLISNN